MRRFLPKLSRRQKLARNLISAAVCLFLMAWMWDFPTWSAENMLERTARQYLLEESELMYVGKDPGLFGGRTLYGRNGGLLLVIQCSPTPLGLRYAWSELINEPVFCTTRFHDPTDILMLVTDPACASAELSITLGETVLQGDVGEVVWMKEDYTAQSEKIADGVFRFRLEPIFGEDDDSLAAKTEREIFSGHRVGDQENLKIRLYDENGQLLSTHTPRGLESDASWAW